ncbi:MAG TPA: hypothetical protein VLS93_16470 [Anaeromyxobacteraceae bacterium]|nr:hypothetical protein [Anaeromyxobacteraceae bacterium]
MDRSSSSAADVAAGRAWVEAYVPYVHWVQGVYEAAEGKAGAHAPEAHAAESHAPAAESHAHEHARQ